MLSPKTPQAELDAARQRFADALEAAEVQPEYRLGLVAACEAVAKARTTVALALALALATIVGKRSAVNDDQAGSVG